MLLLLVSWLASSFGLWDLCFVPFLLFSRQIYAEILSSQLFFQAFVPLRFFVADFVKKTDGSDVIVVMLPLILIEFVFVVVVVGGGKEPGLHLVLARDHVEYNYRRKVAIFTTTTIMTMRMAKRFVRVRNSLGGG